MKYVLITGAAGLLGSYLAQHLSLSGYRTIGVRHNNTPNTDLVIENLSDLSSQNIQHLDLVINLAGAPIAGGLWTKARKKTLRDSRILVTRTLISQLEEHQISVRHFLSGSAIGYYGTPNQSVTETSEAGQDFSALLCRDWENEAIEAKKFSETVTLLRTGLVFTPKKGYLEPLKQLTKFGVGAVFGTGEQAISWIDYRDWIKAVLFIIHSRIEGPVNLTAPHATSQKLLMHNIASVMHRKCLFKLPTFLFSPLGEMKTLFLEGQQVKPNRLLDRGFEFSYPTIDHSLPLLLR